MFWKGFYAEGLLLVLLHSIHVEAEEIIRCNSAKPILQREPQVWQDVKDREVKVFSAFYERRVAAGGPAIRVIGTGWQAAYNNIGKLYCTLWYDNQEGGVTVGPAGYDVIYPSKMYPDMWVSHFVMCPLPVQANQRSPSWVSVTATPCGETSNHLMVLNRDDVIQTNTHALCLSPIYGNFKNWSMVIENLELHKLLGASEIVVYNFSISAKTSQVLQSYVEDNAENVKVVQWPYPPLRSNVWCQRGALNDCLYRTGHNHRFVTVTDLDEFLVPRSATRWPDLMRQIDTKASRGIFMFQHAYFRRNSSTHAPPLITQNSLWRTDEVSPPGRTRCKSMYKSALAVSIDLHHHYSLVEGTEEYMLPPGEGMLHHYRADPLETIRKHPERFTFIEDTYMRRYGEALKAAVRKRTNLISKAGKDEL